MYLNQAMPVEPLPIVKLEPTHEMYLNHKKLLPLRYLLHLEPTDEMYLEVIMS